MSIKESECYEGKRVGRLTLLYPVRIPSGRYTRGGWYCKCDCGRYRVARTDGLGKTGNTRVISCGCFNSEQWDRIHNGQWKELDELSDWNDRSLYHTLRARFRLMHERCEDVNHPQYEDYGGRGIEVCDDWSDYENYKQWMLDSGFDINKPARSQTVDRIDVDKGYSPDNCRLLDMYGQANNKRTNIFVNYKNKNRTLTEWGRQFDIQYQTLKKRYDAGWRGDKLFQSVTHTNDWHPTTVYITYHGKAISVYDFSRTKGILSNVALDRYRRGLRDEGLIREYDNKTESW